MSWFIFYAWQTISHFHSQWISFFSDSKKFFLHCKKEEKASWISFCWKLKFMVGTTTLTLLSLMFSLPISFVRIVLESTNSNAKIGKLDMLQVLLVLEQAPISMNLSFVKLQNSEFDQKSRSGFICFLSLGSSLMASLSNFRPCISSFYNFEFL